MNERSRDSAREARVRGRRPSLAPVPPVSAAEPTPDAGWMAAWVGQTGDTADRGIDAAEESDEHSSDTAEAAQGWMSSELLGDDPMAELAADVRQRALRAKQRRRRRVRAGIGAGVVATVAALVIGVVLITIDGKDVPGSQQALVPATPAPTTTLSTVASTTTAAWCQEINTAARVVGSGPGDLTSPVGVILYQQHAFYVRRDADAVRSVLTPDAVAAPVERTREAIDQTPAGTRHCVTITPRGPDAFTVQITERYPDGSQTGWEQVETTVQRDGRTWIASITAGGN